MVLNTNYKDQQYFRIVNPILEHDAFLRMKDYKHHGTNRFDHSLRVSYYSYKISKFMGLDAVETARGGLLHDFFFDECVEKRVLLQHPKYALEMACQHFDLSLKEQDIIRAHMFPVVMRPPQYMESWIVDLVDDIVSIYERCYFISRQFITTSNFLVLLLFTCLK